MAFYPLHPLQINEKDVYLPKKGITSAYSKKVGVFYLQGASRVQNKAFLQAQKHIYYYISIF